MNKEKSVVRSPYQVAGSSTEKARRCLVAVREREKIAQLMQLSVDAGLAWWSSRTTSSILEGARPSMLLHNISNCIKATSGHSFKCSTIHNTTIKYSINLQH